MPNWCNNSITISHTDPEKWKWFVDSKFDFNIISPLDLRPKEEVEKDPFNTYRLCWGTKWPIDEDWVKEEFKPDNEKMTLDFNFDTAWAPPIPIYSTLAEKGFKIQAIFEEPNDDFVGWAESCDDGSFFRFEEYSLSEFSKDAYETRHLHRDNLDKMIEMIDCPPQLADKIKCMYVDEWIDHVWAEDDEYTTWEINAERFSSNGGGGEDVEFEDQKEAIDQAYEYFEEEKWDRVILFKYERDGESEPSPGIEIYTWERERTDITAEELCEYLQRVMKSIEEEGLWDEDDDPICYSGKWLELYKQLKKCWNSK